MQAVQARRRRSVTGRKKWPTRSTMNGKYLFECAEWVIRIWSEEKLELWPNKWSLH